MKYVRNSNAYENNPEKKNNENHGIYQFVGQDIMHTVLDKNENTTLENECYIGNGLFDSEQTTVIDMKTTAPEFDDEPCVS